MLNSEKVQHARDMVVANLQKCSEDRKRVRDRKAKVREFLKGDQVFLSKAGMNTKLSDSWEGPYQVVKMNTPLSYRISTGDRVLPSVHIQQLKAYIPRPEPKVGRVTSVLEPDSQADSMDEEFTEARVTGSYLQRQGRMTSGVGREIMQIP